MSSATKTKFIPLNDNVNLLVRIKFYNLFFIYNVVLNKNWKIYWSEQSFTGLGLKDWCLSWGRKIKYLHCKIIILLVKRIPSNGKYICCRNVSMSWKTQVYYKLFPGFGLCFYLESKHIIRGSWESCVSYAWQL